MITLEKVNKYFNKGKSNEIHVIDNTSMTLPDRGIVCLLGPSGCGKTTLLNAIGGLDKVSSGKIKIDNQLITRRSSSKIDTIRNARIGYIFQNFNLLDDKTVFENVAIALRMIGIKDKKVIQDRVRYCLEKVGIDQYRNRLCSALSGGQRQRVAIARAIVKNPRIIIADEPTGNLDSANTLEIMNIIKTISKDRLVILVTHERHIAEFYSDHVAEMKDGKIVKAYNNDSSRYLDYQLENKIYLKDMAVKKDFKQDDMSVKVYSDEERQADIKVVIRGNNLYIDTGGKLNVVDETSNIEMIDGHYSAMDESFFEENSFDYSAYMPLNYKTRYTSIYKLTNMISSGWRTVSNFKKVRKFLMVGFVFAAMFTFLAVSNVLGILEVKPVDYRTTSGNYVTISNPDKTRSLLNAVQELNAVEYVLPGDTRKGITMPLDDYLQTSYATYNLPVSIALTRVLTPDQIVEGAMPANEREVVLDKAYIDKFLREGRGKQVGLDTQKEFIGRKLKVTNLKDYVICGISDTESPTLYVDESQAMYIIVNAGKAQDESEFDYMDYTEDDTEGDIIQSGKIKDIDLADAKLKITKGNKPKAIYEVIINNNYAEEIAIGKTVNTKVAGRKLKVVGYYTSNSPEDDTYYVHHDTIDTDYIMKQKSFTAYASNPKQLKAILDQQKMSSKINDSSDKKTYIRQRREQLSSALIVAGIIMLIALIEMFLMLRSSFLSRIKEVGTMRAIGLKKKDIYRMFIGEILVITIITAIPGILLMYYILSQVVKINYYFEGLYMLSPIVGVVALAIVVLFNLISGLIPVFVTMRKTPAEILARTDI